MGCKNIPGPSASSRSSTSQLFLILFLLPFGLYPSLLIHFVHSFSSPSMPELIFHSSKVNRKLIYPEGYKAWMGRFRFSSIPFSLTEKLLSLNLAQFNFFFPDDFFFQKFSLFYFIHNFSLSV